MAIHRPNLPAVSSIISCIDVGLHPLAQKSMRPLVQRLVRPPSQAPVTQKFTNNVEGRLVRPDGRTYSQVAQAQSIMEGQLPTPPLWARQPRTPKIMVAK